MVLARVVFVAGVHTIRQQVITVHLLQLTRDGGAIGVVTRDEPPFALGLERHGVVHHMRGQRELLLVYFRPKCKVRELPFPIVPLLAQLARQVEQARLTRSIVEPEHADHFIAPPEHGPFLERARFHHAQLVSEVAPHQWNHAGVAGGFVILRQRFQHDHIRPPVLVLFGTE